MQEISLLILIVAVRIFPGSSTFEVKSVDDLDRCSILIGAED
jgi:hypothetical protein